MEGILSLCIAGRGRTWSQKSPYGSTVTEQPLWRKAGTAPPWINWEQAETDSLIKRKVNF
jgi:hypothetical protein